MQVKCASMPEKLSNNGYLNWLNQISLIESTVKLANDYSNCIAHQYNQAVLVEPPQMVVLLPNECTNIKIIETPVAATNFCDTLSYKIMSILARILIEVAIDYATAPKTKFYVNHDDIVKDEIQTAKPNAKYYSNADFGLTEDSHYDYSIFNEHDDYADYLGSAYLSSDDWNYVDSSIENSYIDEVPLTTGYEPEYLDNNYPEQYTYYFEPDNKEYNYYNDWA